MIVLFICAVGAFICTATDRRPLRVLGDGSSGTRSGVLVAAAGVILSATGAILMPRVWEIAAVTALLIACCIWIGRRRRMLWLIAGATTLLLFASPLSALAAISAVAGAEIVRMSGRAHWPVVILVAIAIADVIAFRLGVLERFAVAGVGADIEMHPLAAISAGNWQMGVGDVFCAALGGALAASKRGVAAFSVGMGACMFWAVTTGVTVPASAPALLAVALHRTRRSAGTASHRP